MKNSKRLLSISLLIICVAMASKAQVSDTWRGQRDTIPWHLMDLAGPRSKPGFLHGHPTKKYPVLPMIGGAIIGGGVVWLLTRDGGGGESTLLVPHDDAMTIACGASTVTLNVLNNDEGDGLKVVSVSPPPGITVLINGGNLTVSGLSPGSITFSYSVEDASGKVLSANVTITVTDEEPPVLTCPADVSVECGASTEISVTGVATATNACGGEDLVVSWEDVMSGQVDCVNSTTLQRTFTVTNPAGISRECVQVITLMADATPPEILCPPNAEVPCSFGADPQATGFATANDLCSQNVEVKWYDMSTSPIERIWTATDDCGNSSSCEQLITISPIPVEIDCPANTTISCEEDIAPDNTGEAEANVPCLEPFEITYQDDLSGLTMCNGTGDLLRTWSLTTALGDSVACQQIITIIDETPPSITCPPTTTAACSGTPDPDPSVTGFPEGEDNCSMDLNFDYTDDASGVTNCEGDLIRTWKATDECGNSSTCEQTITMEPSVAPEITCPATMTVECNVVPDPAVTGEAAATFHCGDPTAGSLVHEDDDSGLGGCNGTGTLIRTWTATDDCGNSSSCTQSIAVEDNTPPVITCPGNAEAVCMEPNDPSVTGMAVATDNCSSTPGLVYEDDDSGVMNCKGSMIRTWTATDECGNAASCDQLITILPPPCTFTTTFSVANADCGLANGVAVANVSPSGNYAYQWSNGTTGLVLSDVPAGNYQVTITDVDLSCELTFEVTIGENPPQYVTGLVVSPADCPNGGDISFIVSGGQGPYEVVVSGPAGTNSIQNIPNGTEVHVNAFMPVGPGNYTIQVTDQAAGPPCTEVFTVSVNEAPPYALQVLQVNPPSSPSAPDGSIKLQVVNPGAHPPPYQVIVNGDVVGVANSPVFTILNLPAGIYEIMVLDQFECPSETVVVELLPMFAFDYSPSVNAIDLNLHLSGGPPEHPNTEHYSVTDMVLLNGSTLTIYRHRQAGNFIAFGLSRAEGQLLAESMQGQRLSSSFQLLQPRLMAGHQFRLPKGNIRLSAGVYARYLQLDEHGLMPSRHVRTGFSLEAGFELPFGKCGVFSLPLSVFPFGKQGREMGFQPRLSWRF